MILYEYMHFFRVIPIDKPHPDDVELTFMGDAVAKWDGDTLVIDTIGLKSWPISASNQWHSDALHTLERLHHIRCRNVRRGQGQKGIQTPRALSKRKASGVRVDDASGTRESIWGARIRS